VPNVRTKIFSTLDPAVVVAESGGSTSVSEYPDAGPGLLSAAIAEANGLVDTIDVRLSSQPSGTVHVSLANGNDQLEFYDDASLTLAHKITQLTFDAGTWSTNRTVWVKAINDGVVENFHKGDLALHLNGYRDYLTSVDIGDNNYPGVRIVESNGSTTVAESTTELGVT
jgi:hypothetical protein